MFIQKLIKINKENFILNILALECVIKILLLIMELLVLKLKVILSIIIYTYIKLSFRTRYVPMIATAMRSVNIPNVS